MPAPICSSARSIAARTSRRQKAVRFSLIRSFTSDGSSRGCNVQFEPAQSTSTRQLGPSSSPMRSSKSQNICRRTAQQIRSLSTSRSLGNNYSPSNFIPVPYVQHIEGGVNHSTDLFSRLLRERVVCCYGPVEDRMASTIIASLLYLESEDPSSQISLYINSPGGSVSSGLAIYDTMQYISAPISCIVLGQAASMGSLLACAGSPGKRYILPHATVMMHQPSGGFSGTQSDIAIQAKEILRLRDQLNNIYKRHLNTEDVLKRRDGREIGLEEIEKLLERDSFLSPEEAVKLGVVDEILQSRKLSNKDEKKD